MMIEEQSNVFEELKGKTEETLELFGRTFPVISNRKMLTSSSFGKAMFKKQLTKEDYKTLFSNFIVSHDVVLFIMQRIGITNREEFLEYGGAEFIIVEARQYINSDYRNLIENFPVQNITKELTILVNTLLSKTEYRIHFSPKDARNIIFCYANSQYLSEWKNSHEEQTEALEFVHSNYDLLYKMFNTSEIFKCEFGGVSYPFGCPELKTTSTEYREGSSIIVSDYFYKCMHFPLMNFNHLKSTLSFYNVTDKQDRLLAVLKFLSTEKNKIKDVEEATFYLAQLLLSMDDKEIQEVVYLFPEADPVNRNSFTHWEYFEAENIFKSLKSDILNAKEREVIFDKIIVPFLPVASYKGSASVISKSLKNMRFRDAEIVKFIQELAEMGNISGNDFYDFQHLFEQNPEDKWSYPQALTLRCIYHYCYSWNNRDYDTYSDIVKNDWMNISEKDLRTMVKNNDNKGLITWDMAGDYKFLKELMDVTKSSYEKSSIFSRIRINTLREKAYELFIDNANELYVNSEVNFYGSARAVIPYDSSFKHFYKDVDLVKQYKGILSFQGMIEVPELIEDIEPFIQYKLKTTKRSWRTDDDIRELINNLEKENFYSDEIRTKITLGIMKSEFAPLLNRTNYNMFDNTYEFLIPVPEGMTVEELLKIERGM